MIGTSDTSVPCCVMLFVHPDTGCAAGYGSYSIPSTSNFPSAPPVCPWFNKHSWYRRTSSSSSAATNRISVTAASSWMTSSSSAAGFAVLNRNGRYSYINANKCAAFFVCPYRQSHPPQPPRPVPATVLTCFPNATGRPCQQLSSPLLSFPRF